MDVILRIDNEIIDVNIELMMRKNIILEIKVHYSANFGEEINLVGNLDQIGNWDPWKGIKLSWNEVV